MCIRDSITLVRLPKISQGRSEPSIAFPMPIQVEASPPFQPNLPASPTKITAEKYDVDVYKRQPQYFI